MWLDFLLEVDTSRSATGAIAVFQMTTLWKWKHKLLLLTTGHGNWTDFNTVWTTIRGTSLQRGGKEREKYARPFNKSPHCLHHGLCVVPHPGMPKRTLAEGGTPLRFKLAKIYESQSSLDRWDHPNGWRISRLA